MRPLHGPNGRIRRTDRNRHRAHRGGQGILAVFGFLWIVLGINQPEISGMTILIIGGLGMFWLAWTSPKPRGISKKTLQAIGDRSRARFRRDWPEEAKLLDDLHLQESTYKHKESV